MEKIAECPTNTRYKCRQSENSTAEDSNDRFFLQNGLKRPATNTEDSFSFSQPPNGIFSPRGNLSCMKKETPRFGRAENQKSTPTRNMIRKLTAIRNQIRLQRNMENVLHEPPMAQDPLDIPTEESGLEFRRTSATKKRASKKKRGDFGVKLEENLEASTQADIKAVKTTGVVLGLKSLLEMKSAESILSPFASKGSPRTHCPHCTKSLKNSKSICRCRESAKRLNRRTSRSPKILGQKIWEIFQTSKTKTSASKRMLEIFKPQTATTHLNNMKPWQRRRKGSDLNFQSNRCLDTSQTLNVKSSRQAQPQNHKKSTWGLGYMTNPLAQTKLRAKKLPIEFQQEFRNDLLQCFQMSNPQSQKMKPNTSKIPTKWGNKRDEYFKSTQRKRRRPESHKRGKNRAKQNFKTGRKPVLVSLRYQSAKKENVNVSERSDFGFSRRSSRNRGAGQFLYDEMRYMMDSKKGALGQAKRPVRPSFPKKGCLKFN